MKGYSALLLGVAGFGLWLTPDQQGYRLFERGEFARAAAVFHDSNWRAAAWYRAGEFKLAAEEFAHFDSAEANYNQGNARLMMGTYDAAIACYDRALALRPDFIEAVENRAIAVARAKMVESTGGDMGEQTIGADELVFDAKFRSEDQGQDTEIAGAEALSDQQIQSLWLRKVQTRPADFLRNKFLYQQAQRGEAP